MGAGIQVVRRDVKHRLPVIRRGGAAHLSGDIPQSSFRPKSASDIGTGCVCLALERLIGCLGAARAGINLSLAAVSNQSGVGLLQLSAMLSCVFVIALNDFQVGQEQASLVFLEYGPGLGNDGFQVFPGAVKTVEALVQRCPEGKQLVCHFSGPSLQHPVGIAQETGISGASGTGDLILYGVCQLLWRIR